MVTEGDLTLGDGHTMQYTDHLSQKCTPEIYIVLLSNVTPINSINTHTHTHKGKNYCKSNES